jgi:2,3-dihydroxyphenylpropionate 1,2-dioxygenase
LATREGDAQKRPEASERLEMVAMSHSPFATMLPPPDQAAPGGRFMADTVRVATAVAALAPDALVVIGPDHFHANFYDAMPPFVLGVEEVSGFGDFGSRSGPLPVASALAWSIRDGLARDGFDIALSYALTVDHGVTQSYDMVRGQADLPMVPLVVNTAAPPLPSMERCLLLGRSLGAAIRSASSVSSGSVSSGGGRVLVVASGGLSHWLPSNDPRDDSLPAERRAAVIHGRRDVRAFSADREPRVRAMAGNPDAPVNLEWDAWFLKQLITADFDPVTALGDDGLEQRAGSGAHEIRTWLIAMAAVGRPLVWTSYEPVPEWITGMGIGATFEVPRLPGHESSCSRHQSAVFCPSRVRAACQCGSASIASVADGCSSNTRMSPVTRKTVRIFPAVATSASDPSCSRTRLRLPTRAPSPVESRNSTSRRSTTMCRVPLSISLMTCSRSCGAEYTSISPATRKAAQSVPAVMD